MNWIVRLDVIVLALMLACVVLVVTRISYRYHLARNFKETDSASRRQLAAVLSIEVGCLKAIASSAPYLGLAGTCVGLLSSLGFGVAMEKNTFVTMVAANMASALAATAAGILVAVPATCSYNYLCTLRDSLAREMSNDLPPQITRARQSPRRLVSAKRFSELPTFALIAASGLSALVAVFTPYFAPREPTGLVLELASDRCESDYRPIILHVTDAGKLFINLESSDQTTLVNRLSRIYSTRAERTLYLVVDDGVPFQSAAEVIDMVRNTPFPTLPGQPPTPPELGSHDLKITVSLVTPSAKKGRCPAPVLMP